MPLIEDRESTPREPQHAWEQPDRRDLIELCMDAGQAMHEAVTEFSQLTLADLEEYALHYRDVLKDASVKLTEKIMECQRRMSHGHPSRWENSE